MQVGFKVVPVTLLAAEDQIIKQIFLQSLSQVLGHKFKMMESFILHATLGVATIITSETVATAAARQRTKQALLLFHFIQSQIEDASFVAIQQHDTDTGMRAQQRSQRLQVEATIDKKLRAGQLWWQIKLAPEVPVATGENGLGASLIAVQLPGQFHNAPQVTPQTYILAI